MASSKLHSLFPLTPDPSSTTSTSTSRSRATSPRAAARRSPRSLRAAAANTFANVDTSLRRNPSRRSPRVAAVDVSSATSPSIRSLEPISPTAHGEYLTHAHRDSVLSIKDDPFFKNYQTPQSLSIARQLRAAAYQYPLDAGDAALLRDIPLETTAVPDHLTARMSHASTTAAAVEPTTDAAGHSLGESINIVVMGAAGVGKSTLIKAALGLRSLPARAVAQTKMSMDDTAYTVSLIELNVESIDVSPDRGIDWREVPGLTVPRVDGALILYDVMNRESIAELPQNLNALVNAAVPSILVACKCDNPANTRQIDTDSIDAACLASVECVKTAATVPESARLCLSAMLRTVMTRRSVTGTPGVDRSHRRAASSTNLDLPTDRGDAAPPSQHSRASSEGFSLAPRPLPASSRKSQLHPSTSTTTITTTAPASSHPAAASGSPTAHRNLADHAPTPATTSRAASMRSRSSMTDTEESDAESAYRYSDDVPILMRSDDGFAGRANKVVGVSFDELVDRLLTQPMSRADANFGDIFLCLYRKFAAPGELLTAILARLERISEEQHVHYLTRTSTQLRIITVIVKWVSTYPGDFASAHTSRRLEALISQMAADPIFAAAAQEMRMQLRLHVVEDDDTGWARTDAEAEAESDALELRLWPGSPPRPAATDLTQSMSSMTMDEDEAARRLSRRPSAATTATTATTSSVGTYPSQSMDSSLHMVEDYEREASTLVPTSTLPLTKFRYRIFMDTPDDELAEEMTRIDWIMFSSIRLRDLVRHVSLSLEARNKCRGLDNVNRMIDHFNHIARWVSNMVLMRDKPKHRAQMLEKFIRIGHKLRTMNNYNGLAAVIAGINGSAIHRLVQTHALVSPENQKQFQKLQLLMSTQKSHFAYRLAWENSPFPRIPFIPLHRRDLVSAEEGSRTFVGPNGDRINWKKFEILAEVILPLMKSQLVPYPHLVAHDSARELILECRMPTDDEEIYSRSLAVEGSSSSLEIGKKKFPWFQK